jgi:hypothetical protein
MNKVKAIQSLKPNAEWVLKDDVLEWLDGSQTEPTALELRLQAEYDSQAYARNRKAEYDALNQLEMQYDDKANGTTTWEDAIAAIKTKYPKG